MAQKREVEREREREQASKRESDSGDNMRMGLLGFIEELGISTERKKWDMTLSSQLKGWDSFSCDGASLVLLGCTKGQPDS